MAISDRLPEFALRPRLPARLRALSPRRLFGDVRERLPALRPRFRVPRRAVGGALLVAAAGLGFWAQDLSRFEALWDWEHGHFPGPIVWRHALGGRGFQSVDPASSFGARATRTLPATLDAAGAIWVSADSEWLAVWSRPTEAIPMELYCRECRFPPSAWQPGGRGWQGFEQALAHADATARPARAIARGPVGDARELRF
jgi:hypothetical protein